MTIQNYYEKKYIRTKNFDRWLILFFAIFSILSSLNSFEKGSIVSFLITLIPTILFSVLVYFLFRPSEKPYTPPFDIGSVIRYKNGFIFPESISVKYEILKLNPKAKKVLLKNLIDSQYKEEYLEDLLSNYQSEI